MGHLNINKMGHLKFLGWFELRLTVRSQKTEWSWRTDHDSEQSWLPSKTSQTSQCLLSSTSFKLSIDTLALFRLYKLTPVSFCAMVYRQKSWLRISVRYRMLSGRIFESIFHGAFLFLGLWNHYNQIFVPRLLSTEKMVVSDRTEWDLSTDINSDRVHQQQRSLLYQ
jgi:hypothetical protein